MIKGFDVFVSYRRIDGSHLAQLIRNSLSDQGYQVFVDVREMPAGPFPQAITETIRATSNFVPLLTPHCLDRYGQSADWFGREIQLAMEFDRNIVPLRTDDFQPPHVVPVPDVLKSLLHLHHIMYSHEYSDAAIEALCKRLVNLPSSQAATNRSLQGSRELQEVPINVTRHNQWGLDGSVKEVSFLLRSKSHTITLRRHDHIFSQEMVLALDGEEMFRKQVSFPMISFIREQFLIDGVVCTAEINFVAAGWFGNIKVAGYIVLDEPLLSF